MRVHGLVCVKNESSRYLDACLSWMSNILDDIFVYDDRSSDDSVAIAISNGCEVSIRQSSDPSFMDHEGKFRAIAWNYFEQNMSPSLGDWIFAFDSDEFLVADGDIRTAVNSSISYAESHGDIACMIHFPEVFKILDNRLFIRTDGFWGDIFGPRLFAYRPDATWSNKPMGCGSQPEYVSRGGISKKTYGLEMLHFGYASDLDKKIKYDRYSSVHNNGHSNSHIESILSNPVVSEWNGLVPELNKNVP